MTNSVSVILPSTLRTYPDIKKVLPYYEDVNEDFLRNDPVFCAMGLGILYQINLLIDFMQNIKEVQLLTSKMTIPYYHKGFRTQHFKVGIDTLL